MSTSGLAEEQIAAAIILSSILHNASPELVAFGGSAYRRRSPGTSALLVPPSEKLRAEDFAMPYMMEDFKRDFVKEHFPELTPEEKEEVLQKLPVDQRLAGLSAEEIQRYLDRLSSGRRASPRKPRRKK